MLVLLGVSSALVLLELEFSQVGNATHWWIGGRRDFDQIQTSLLSPTNRFLDRHDPDLASLGVEDAYLRGADLLVCPWASRRRWPRNEWWTWNRRFSFTRSND
jgi:hypothetical protein